MTVMSELPIVTFTPDQLRALYQRRVADHDCPWCGARAWDDGTIVVAHVFTENNRLSFTKEGVPELMRLAIEYRCRQCRWLASFGFDTAQIGYPLESE